MRTRGSVLVGLALLTLSACSADSTASHGDDKYRQSWAKAYADTTCGEYRNDMTAQQRWAMAADVLTSARKVDGNNTLPTDRTISIFRDDVATACAADATALVTEVSVALYASGSTYYQP